MMPYWAQVKLWEKTNQAVDVMRIELSVAEVCKADVIRKLSELIETAKVDNSR